MSELPHIAAGQRALLAGRTGSGKTTVACWLLSRSPQHWVIFNPKHTVGYRTLPDSIIIKRFDTKPLLSLLKRHKYVILNLSNDEATPEFMDAILEWLHRNVKNIGVCIDELYTFHSAGGRAGDGLIGFLTRGRELKQSILQLTQRPAWVSRFCFSESDFIGTMDLVLEDDRKKMREMTGQDAFLERVTHYRWLWYTVARDFLSLYGPVPTAVGESHSTEKV
jgi:hypothetical protein